MMPKPQPPKNVCFKF